MTETLIEKAPLILTGKGYELLIAPDAEARKLDLLQAASGITAVTSNNESAAAQFHSRRLAAMRIEVEKCRKAVKEPVNKIGKMIDKTAADFVAEIDAEEKRINRLVGAHAEEVARIKRMKEEEERRAFEEARRARQEAERAAAEADEARENKASIAEVIAARKAAEAAERERQEALTARMAASEEVAATNVASGVRFAWDFEVDSIEHVFRMAPAFVTMEIKRAAVLAWFREMEVADKDVEPRALAIGIRAFKKPVVSTR